MIQAVFSELTQEFNKQICLTEILQLKHRKVFGVIRGREYTRSKQC